MARELSRGPPATPAGGGGCRAIGTVGGVALGRPLDRWVRAVVRFRVGVVAGDGGFGVWRWRVWCLDLGMGSGLGVEG